MDMKTNADRRTANIERRLAKLSEKELQSLLRDHLRCLGAHQIADESVIAHSTRHLRQALARFTR